MIAPYLVSWGNTIWPPLYTDHILVTITMIFLGLFKLTFYVTHQFFFFLHNNSCGENNTGLVSFS